MKSIILILLVDKKKKVKYLITDKALFQLGTVYALEPNIEKNLSYCQICVTITKKAFLILPVLAILVTQCLNKKSI